MNAQKLTINNIDVFLEHRDGLILTVKGENLFIKLIVIDAPIRGLIASIVNAHDLESIQLINNFVDHVRDLMGLNLEFTNNETE